MARIKPYLIVNLVLAGICGLVFLYSGLFSAESGRHPVPSFYEKIRGEPSPSSGMSRAFSEIIRGNTESAREYNPDSLRIFAFFMVQGIQRIAVSLLLLPIGRFPNRKGKRKAGNNDISPGIRNPAGLRLRILLSLDAASSMILFLYCFAGQIRAMARLFNII